VLVLREWRTQPPTSREKTKISEEKEKQTQSSFFFKLLNGKRKYMEICLIYSWSMLFALIIPSTQWPGFLSLINDRLALTYCFVATFTNIQRFPLSPFMAIF
jgi:hypothetical protein